MGEFEVVIENADQFDSALTRKGCVREDYPPFKPFTGMTAYEPSPRGPWVDFIGSRAEYEALKAERGEPFFMRENTPTRVRCTWKAEDA